MMKKFVGILFLALLQQGVSAQKSDSCSCSRNFSLNYPKEAEKAGVCGTVVLEAEIDSAGILLDPIVKKGLGYGCDEEALRVTRLQVAFLNECNRRCPSKKRRPVLKMEQEVRFVCPD